MQYGPKLVTNGLTLCLDAADANSYPGSGTTFTDLTNNGNNASISGATHSSTNKGYFDFNGSSNLMTISNSVIPDSTLSYSVLVWCKRDRNSSGYEELLSQWTSANSSNSFYFGFNNSNVRFTDNWSDVTVSGAGDTSNWMHLVGVYNTTNAYIYLNGSLAATKGSGFSYTGTANLIVGRQGGLSSEYFDGKIALIQIYNRALDPEEIVQNYNVQKSIF